MYLDQITNDELADVGWLTEMTIRAGMTVMRTVTQYKERQMAELTAELKEYRLANPLLPKGDISDLSYLDGHLNDGFKQLMAAEKLPSTVATMISKLPEEDQAALLQRQREDPAAFNTGTVMTYLREKSKAAEEQAATDDTGAELTVGKDFIAEIRQQVRDIDFLLSKGDRRIQKGRSAKLLRLQKQVREKLEDMKEVIELGVKK